MDPVFTPMAISLAVSAASQAVSAIGQWITEKKAKGERDDNLRKMEDIFAKLDKPKYDESGIPLPNYDITTLTPEDYKVLEKAVPTIATRIKEVAPTLVQETGDMKTGRSAQMDALSRLRKVGSGGADPEYLNKIAQSSRAASADAQSKIDSILQSQARRGMLGSGNQLAAQLQGASSSMDRQSQEGMNAAAESYRNQLQALRDSATLGGQVRTADMDLQGRNADIINAYNNRSAIAGQGWENDRATAMTNANQYNVGVGQRIGDANVDQRNENRRYYQTLGNTAAGARYNDQMGAQAAHNNLQDRKFQNDATIAQGRIGQLGARTAAAQSDAAGQRDAISGIMGGIGSTAMAWGANELDEQDRATNNKFRTEDQAINRDWVEQLKIQNARANGGKTNVYKG